MELLFRGSFFFWLLLDKHISVNISSLSVCLRVCMCVYMCVFLLLFHTHKQAQTHMTKTSLSISAIMNVVNAITGMW